MIRRWWLSLFPKKCDMCGGKGYSKVPEYNYPASFGNWRYCRVCRGTGKTR